MIKKYSLLISLVVSSSAISMKDTPTSFKSLSALCAAKITHNLLKNKQSTSEWLNSTQLDHQTKEILKKELLSPYNGPTRSYLKDDVMHTSFSISILGTNVTKTAISPDASFIVIGYHDGRVRIHDSQGYRDLPNAHQAQVTAIAISLDSRFIVTGSGDCKIRVWNTQTDNHIIEATTEDSVSSIAISSDNNFIAASDDKGTIKQWNIKTGTLQAQYTVDHLPPGLSMSSSITISPNNRFVVAICSRILDYNNNNVYKLAPSDFTSYAYLWDTESNTLKKLNDNFSKDILLAILSTNFIFTVSPLSYSTHRDADHYDPANISVWDTQTGQRLQLLLESVPLCTLALSSDGTLAIAGAHNHTIYNNPLYVNVQREDKYLDKDKVSVSLWDTKTCRLIKTLDTKASIELIAISSDKSFAVIAGVETNEDTGQREDTLSIWDVRTGTCIVKHSNNEYNLPQNCSIKYPYQYSIRSLAISPDNSSVTAIYKNERVHVLNIASRLFDQNDTISIEDIALCIHTEDARELKKHKLAHTELS
jgi:WD40 repeat protein